MAEHPGSFSYGNAQRYEYIKALKAPRLIDIPNKLYQLNSDEEGRKSLELIRKHYIGFGQGFEECAIDLVTKMDQNFVDFNRTRPWRDGGRDALGY